MRRSIALGLALLCAAAFFAGCGDYGDTGAAAKLLRKGNRQYDALSAGFLDLADQLEKFFVGHAWGAITDPGEIERRMNSYSDTLDRLLNQAGEAEKTYRKVLALAMVPRHKDYARKRLQMLGQINKTRDVVVRTFPIITGGLEAGRPADSNALEGAKREIIGIEMELSFMEAEAKEIARDHHVTR